MNELAAYHEMYPEGPEWPNSMELAEFNRRCERAFCMTYDERETVARLQEDLVDATEAYAELKQAIRGDWIDMLENEHYDELLVAMEMI